MAKKFLAGKAPYIRAVDERKISTTRMMNDVLVALVPIILFAWYKNGLKPFLELENTSTLVLLWPLLFVLVGGATSILLEGFYFATFKGVRGIKNLWQAVNLSYAILPGILLALILPLYTPLWVLMFGCLIANIVFKMLFGGFGHNIFNPALIGYAFVLIAFSGVIGEGYMSPGDLFHTTSSATPLTNYAGLLGGSYQQLVAPYGNLWNFFIGTIPGSFGETSALLCIVAFIYLVVRKTINWRIPVIYVGTVFILTWIVGAINGQPGIWYPLFNILSGGLLFGAVFMATEPVTTPKSPNGKIIFAFGLGVCTVLFRLIGAMPEGVATSILFMCLFTPIIDRFAAKLRSTKFNHRVVLKYCSVAIIFIAIAGYTLYKAVPTKANDTGTDLPDGVTLIYANTETGVTSVTIQTKGYHGMITAEATIENGAVKTFVITNHSETYSSYGGFNGTGKDPIHDLPNDLLAAGDLFDGVASVSGATYTSNAVKLMYEYLIKYKTQIKTPVLPANVTLVYSKTTNGLTDVTIQTNGYAGLMTAKATIQYGAVKSFVITEANESYESNSEFNPSGKDPIHDLPNDLLAAGDLFDGVATISGATITSNAVQLLYQYLIAFKGGLE